MTVMTMKMRSVAFFAVVILSMVILRNGGYRHDCLAYMHVNMPLLSSAHVYCEVSRT